MAAATKGRARSRAPANKSREELAAFNDRLSRVETTVSERLLAFHQGQQQQNAAISGVQDELRKLVSISEKQVELSAHFSHQSEGLKRAFKQIADLAEANNKRWESHEKDNKAVADVVLQHRTGVRLTWLAGGLFAALVIGWATVEKQRMEEKIAAVEARQDDGLRALTSTTSASERRIENRLDRLERGRDGR